MGRTAHRSHDPDAALVLAITEDPDPERLQTLEGRRALADYSGRMWRWAITPAPSEQLAITADEYDAFWAGRTV